MSSYRELIKNFERIRAYMRDFYVYGFKSREEYDRKSARSYDDERRRVESFLGEHMGFVRTSEGKTVFLSIDSRTVTQNPLHRAWMSKSFTDGDITLHFILLDILSDPAVSLPLADILARMDRDYLAHFDDPPAFDESTVRGKLREYAAEGLISIERDGRRTLYRRAPDVTMPPAPETEYALRFFSEVLPCGVVGTYLLNRAEAEASKDRLPLSAEGRSPLSPEGHTSLSSEDRLPLPAGASADVMEDRGMSVASNEAPSHAAGISASASGRPVSQEMAAGAGRPVIAFKHHYITGTLDADVLAILFDAMREHRAVTVSNHRRHAPAPHDIVIVPLRIFISTQTDRQHVLAYHPKVKRIASFRIDYFSSPRPGEICPDFLTYRAALDELETHMWGVNCKGYLRRTEHVEFTVAIGLGEGYIVDRMERERRCGRVERVDATHYRFSADVYDTSEMIPWIRTFICRIVQLNFSNRTAENQFKADLAAMYRMYGLEEG